MSTAPQVDFPSGGQRGLREVSGTARGYCGVDQTITKSPSKVTNCKLHHGGKAVGGAERVTGEMDTGGN